MGCARRECLAHVSTFEPIKGVSRSFRRCECLNIVFYRVEDDLLLQAFKRENLTIH